MEASTENQVGETTTTPLEEGWIEVPSKKSKKNKGQQQAGSPGGKGSGQGGRGGNQGAATLSSADAEQKAKWAAIEEELKPKVVTSNDFDWSLDVALSAKKSPEPQAQGQTPSNTWSKVLFGGVNRQAQSAQKASVSNEPLSLIGGAHVSYYKNNPKKKDFAVASFVVCSFPALEVVYEAVKEMHVDVPFISGFHSFRDSIPLVSLFEELKANKPELVPQIIFVDGPGVLYKGFGLATHLGVLLNIPTVGVTKKFFNVDGLTENQVRKNVSQDLQKRGEAIEIIGRNSGSVLGAAMRTSDSPKGNYAYISIGHRISLSTAVEVVREASIGKVPQPVYAAEHKVKQELQKLDPKPKKPVAPAGGKNAGAGGNRRNAQGGKGGKKEGGRPGGAGKAGGAVGNGKPQDGKQGGGAGQQGKRRGGPKGPRPQGGQGGQGGQPGQGQGPKQGGAGQPSQGPKQGGGQGGGQGGQGRGRPGGKGPRPQGGGGGQGGGQGGQQGGPQGGQGGKRPGGGRGGNNRPQGGAPKAGNVWTQKAPAGGAAPTSTPSSDGAAAPTPAATTPAAAGQQQRPAGAGNQNKGGQQGGGQAKQGGGQQKKQGGGGGGGGGQQQKKQQPQGEKGGEKQQTAEKKD